MLDTPFWLALSGGLGVYIARLRRRMAGLNDPRLYLSKGERRAWARKELAEADEDRQRDQFERDSKFIAGER